MPSLFDAQMFASLRRHRNYRLYFSGQLVSQIGTWLQNAAQAWLILDITHSPQAVGVFSFFLYLPYAVLGLFGAALADRWDRQRVMIVTQTLMALAAAALAAVAYLHVDSVVVLDGIALVRGSIMAFNNPARQAMMIQLVGRAELPNAIALNASLNNATRIVGPAIAGVLIATVGVAMCFALNAISFVPVIFALAVMRRSEFFATGSRARTPLLISIRDGLHYARRTKTVAVVLSMLFVISTVSINFNVVLPVLAKNTMHGSAQTYGFIAAMFGLGAFAGAIVAASRKRVSPSLLVAAGAGFGAAQLIVATQQSLLGVSLALFATGICYTIYTASSNAIVQLASPPHMQGRIAGLYNYVFLSSGPLGSLLAGWLCERGAPLAFVAGGAAAVAMALVGFALRPWPMPTGTVRPRRRVKVAPIAVVFFALLFVLPAARASADDPLNVCAALNPAFTYDDLSGIQAPCSAVPGALFVEMLYFQNASRVGGTALAAYPLFRLRTGIARRLEVVLDTPSQIAESGPHGIGLYPTTRLGYGLNYTFATSARFAAGLGTELLPPSSLFVTSQTQSRYVLDLTAGYKLTNRSTLSGMATGTSSSSVGLLRIVPAVVVRYSYAASPATEVSTDLGTRVVARKLVSQNFGDFAVNERLRRNIRFSVGVGTAFNPVSNAKAHYLASGFTFRLK